jgi:hypothetical protein
MTPVQEAFVQALEDAERATEYWERHEALLRMDTLQGWVRNWPMFMRTIPHFSVRYGAVARRQVKEQNS